VDPLDLIALTRSLVDIDSTTGREGDCGMWLAAYLRYLGWTVDEQEVGGGRSNVIATLDPPTIVLSTHFDCVPAFFPSRIEGGRLHGRGSCDAKGTLAAQVHAAERLRAAGERRVGLVFVVGEERGSDGAKTANAHPLAAGCRFLVNGEPTSSQLATAHRGVLRIRMVATGRAAHSSHPELGESAIDKLLDALMLVRRLDLPADPVLGRTHYSIGLIEGGIAPNVISPHASAELLFRIVGEGARVRELLRPVENLVDVDEVLEVPAVKLHLVPELETAVFPYTTDIPLLNRWGTPLLLGPGSVHVAHTAEEYVEVAEVRSAVDRYGMLATHLLR
jgi:acetylornithine deacetylase